MQRINFDLEKCRFYAYTRWSVGDTASEIHRDIQRVWGDNCIAYSTITSWLRIFPVMKNEIPEEHRGRPKSTRLPESIAQVQKLITDDPKLTCRDLEIFVGIPRTTVDVILREDLHLRNISCCWIPHSLSNEDKKLRVTCAEEMLKNFTALGNELVRCYTVVDETWIYFQGKGKKSDHRAWVGEGSTGPQVEVSKFGEAKCLLLVAFTPNKKVYMQTLPHGCTMDSDTYINIFHDLGEHWRKLHRDSTKMSEIWLQQDNAPPHVSAKTLGFFSRRGVRLMKQPPFSPDYNLCDRFLFRSLKNDCRFDTFTCAEQVQQAALQWFNDLPEEQLQHQVDELKHHLQNVIHAHGDYITE